LSRNNVKNKESFLDVIKKLGLPLLVCVLVLAGACIFSSSRPAAVLANENLHRDPVSPSLVPLQFETDDDSLLGGIVQESAEVADDYFADAVFAGDSLTDGFKLYGFLREFTTITHVGVNTLSAQTEEFHQVEDGRVLTMVDAIAYYHPRKIYLMIGTNGINWETPQWLIEHYDTLTDMIEAANPDSYIILQSIPATTKSKAEGNSYLALENINEYNRLIEEMCIEKGYYFLDVYSALCTEEGYLPSAIAAYDGTHFGTSGYNTWYNYLKTHTIKGNSAYMVGSDGKLTVSTN